jgi:hypothetical protein
MRVWAWEAGTSRFQILFSCTIVSFITIAIMTISTSCSWFGNSQEEVVQEDSGDYNEDSEEDGGTDESGLVHPKRPTAWYTRIAIATNPQPPADSVADCIDAVSILGEDSGNAQDMQQAQYQLSGSIEQAPAVHHWCFYQMMVALDEALSRGGPLMSDMADKFFLGMKRLWILGRSMDSHHGHTRYFRYLQARYVQISQDKFGRNVMVVGEPLGNMPTTPVLFGKPAGPAPINGGSGPKAVPAPQASQTKSSVKPASLQQNSEENSDENQLNALEEATPDD